MITDGETIIYGSDGMRPAPVRRQHFSRGPGQPAVRNTFEAERIRELEARLAALEKRLAVLEKRRTGAEPTRQRGDVQRTEHQAQEAESARPAAEAGPLQYAKPTGVGAASPKLKVSLFPGDGTTAIVGEARIKAE